MYKTKTIIVIIFLLFISLLAGCTQKKESDEDILNEFLNTLNFEETLTSDLNIKESYNYKNKIINVTWLSSNEKVLTNTGKYYYTTSDEIVTLTGTFILGNEENTKSFDFISYADTDNAFAEAYKSLNLATKTDKTYVQFPSSITYGKTTYRISYSSNNPDIVSNSGSIKLCLEDTEVSVDVTLSAASKSKTFNHTILVQKLDTAALLTKLIDLGNICNLNTEIKSDLHLPNIIEYKDTVLELEWESKNQRVLSNDGIISPDNEDTNVKLVVKTIFNISYTFDLTISAMNDEIALEKAMKEIEIPKVITSDINLETEFKYNTKGTWVSSDQNTISNDGVISKTQNTFKTITYTLTLSKGESTMEKEFETQVSYQAHFFNDRTFKGEKSNVHIENEKLVLDEGKTEEVFLNL